jgi:hypothetical protein
MNRLEEANSMMTEKRRARIAFRCQKKLFDSIEKEAAKRKLTVSALIVEILSESLLSPSFESLVRQNPPIDLLDEISLLLAQVP